MKAFKKLRVRLTIICAVTTGLVLVAMALTAYLFSAGQLRSEAENRFDSEITNLFYGLATQDIVSGDWLYQTEKTNGMLIRVEADGQQLLYTSQSPIRDELTDLVRLQAEEQYGFTFLTRPTSDLTPDVVSFTARLEYGVYRAAVARVPRREGWYNVVLLKDTGEEQAQISRLRNIFMFSVLAALVCLTVVAWFFSVWAAKPIEESRKRQAEFISAVSHELRSPLSVMQINAENIIDAPADMVNRFAEKIVSECQRLARLTTDMIRLARADGHNWEMTFAPTFPDVILLSVLENYQQTAAQRGISFQDQLPPQPLPKIMCDASRLEQVLTILVDNALQYTPEGGTIRLAAFQEKKHVVFQVSDSGVGIPPEKRQRIFDRFYRGDQSRSSKEHFGLGLSIALEIVLLHFGELNVDDSQLGGAEFTVRIPIQVHAG